MDFKLRPQTIKGKFSALRHTGVFIGFGKVTKRSIKLIEETVGTNIIEFEKSRPYNFHDFIAHLPLITLTPFD